MALLLGSAGGAQAGCPGPSYRPAVAYPAPYYPAYAAPYYPTVVTAVRAFDVVELQAYAVEPLVAEVVEIDLDAFRAKHAAYPRVLVLPALPAGGGK